MKSGGSPSGDSAPPTLPTSRMKKTTACTRCRRASLAVRSGRISSIDAPVVPMTLARHGAQGEEAGVDRRGSGERAAKADAARDREQREQHGQERNILEQRSRGRRCAASRPRRTSRRTGPGAASDPDCRELAVVVVPEPRRQQRREGDGQQQAGERQSPRRATARRRRSGDERVRSEGGGDRGPHGKGRATGRAVECRGAKDSKPPVTRRRPGLAAGTV